MNDTLGENGFVPSRLAFGIIRRFPIISINLPNQKDRMKGLANAQMEMKAIVAERRISAALQRNVPSSAHRVHQIGDEVLVYREDPKEWKRSFVVTKVAEKLVTVRDENGNEQTFSSQQIETFMRASQDPDRTDPSDISNEMLKPFRSGKAPPTPLCDIFIIEVIYPSDRRASKFDEAERKEIQGLTDRRTFTIVLKEEESTNAIILGGRFFLAMKEQEMKFGKRDLSYKDFVIK